MIVLAAGRYASCTAGHPEYVGVLLAKPDAVIARRIEDYGPFVRRRPQDLVGAYGCSRTLKRREAGHGGERGPKCWLSIRSGHRPCLSRMSRVFWPLAEVRRER